MPDYVGILLGSIRQSYGRSQFHIRWGAEEAKHADLWRNALLSMGTMTPDAVDEYAADLRQRRVEPQWDHPLRMLFYTVLQERATQVTYVNVGRAFNGDPHVLSRPNATRRWPPCAAPLRSTRLLTMRSSSRWRG